MGSGIDLAGVDAPEHAAVIDNMKDQLLIALVKRLGGKVVMSVMEVDATGSHNLSMKVVDGVFTFKTEAKH